MVAERDNRSAARKTRISFVYGKFYPVAGGSTVHGYYLAYGLAQKGYELFTFQNQDDGFTTKVPKSFFSVLNAFLCSDVIYARLYTVGWRMRLLPLLALLLRRKLVLEVNAPSDELKATGRSDRHIHWYDWTLRRLLPRSTSLIAVSEGVKRYCIEQLRCRDVTVVENGGARIDLDTLTVREEVRRAFATVRGRYQRLAIWSGTAAPWNGLSIIKELLRQSDPSVGFILVTTDPQVVQEVGNHPNVQLFSGLTRDEVCYIVKQSDIGLAIQNDFSWSRYNPYGSPLKYYEYLINGLFVIATTSVHKPWHRYRNLFVGDDPAEIARVVSTAELAKPSPTDRYRSWDDVVDETDAVIRRVLQNSAPKKGRSLAGIGT